MCPEGRFLCCKNCHLSIEFPNGAPYLTIAHQFASHPCSSPTQSKDDPPPKGIPTFSS
jgi:hypothetical protein